MPRRSVALLRGGICHLYNRGANRDVVSHEPDEYAQDAEWEENENQEPSTRAQTRDDVSAMRVVNGYSPAP